MSFGSTAGIIRFVPTFLLGIILSTFVEINIPIFLLILFILLLFLYLHKLIIPSRHHFSIRWLIGLVIHLPVLVSALLISALKTEIKYSHHFSRFLSPSSITCIVNEAPIVKGKNLRFEAELKELNSNDSWLRVKGKVLVYIRIDSLISTPSYGDLLLISKIPQELSPPLNPGPFDFQKWLNRREIYHQLFLKSDDYLIVGHDQGNALLATAIKWRNYLLKSIRDAGITGQEEAVLSALILGQDDEIDPDLRNSYSTAGVMHILAVSGMHVGLIYAALCLILRFPGKRRKANIFKAFFLIICLWFYAMLTGLSPSVLRAAMMLSFLVLGVSLQRSSNPLNILAASAIALFLIFSPALVFSAGFQLSFLAVVGILFLYKPLHNSYTPTSWLGAQVWSIVSVSIVAQLATFPLSLYYFHRFPNYFLISNLIVIPLGTLIIFGGIIVLFLSWWPAAAMFFGKILSLLIQALNGTVSTLGRLPGSSTDGIFLSAPFMLLLYFCIILFALFLLLKRPAYLLYSCWILSVLLSMNICHSYKSSIQNFVLISHSYRQSYIQFYQGKNVLSFTDSLMSKDVKMRNRISEGYFLEKGIKNEHLISMSNPDTVAGSFGGILKCFPFVDFKRSRFYFLTEENKGMKPVSAYVDYLLISGNPKISLKDWLKDVDCRNIIADASNSSWRINEWKTFCDQNEINFIDVSQNGAFEIKFN